MFGFLARYGSSSSTPRISCWVLEVDDPELMKHWNALPGGSLAYCNKAFWVYEETVLRDGRYFHLFRHDCHPFRLEPMLSAMEATQGWAPPNLLRKSPLIALTRVWAPVRRLLTMKPLA